MAGRRDRKANPLRDGILAIIATNPGVRLSRLAQESGCSRGAVRHHIEALVAAGLVKASAAAGHRQFFPASAGPEAMAAAPGHALVPHILGEMARAPGQSVTRMAQTLRVPRQTLAYQVHRLAAEGRVRLRRSGNAWRILPP